MSGCFGHNQSSLYNLARAALSTPPASISPRRTEGTLRPPRAKDGQQVDGWGCQHHLSRLRLSELWGGTGGCMRPEEEMQRGSAIKEQRRYAKTHVGRGGVSIQGAVWECPGPHSSQTLLNLGNLGIRTECTGSVSYKRSRRVFRKNSSVLFPCRKTFPIQSGRYPKASWQDRI